MNAKSSPRTQTCAAQVGEHPVTPSVRHPWLGGIDVVTALLLLGCVWGVLPARWWPVDVAATLLGALLAASGVGLLAGASWARRAGLVASAVTLGLGLALVTTLALTASYLSGLYGPVGRGGAVILILVAALACPYLVLFPAAQLVALRRGP